MQLSTLYKEFFFVNAYEYLQKCKVNAKDEAIIHELASTWSESPIVSNISKSKSIFA